jgi:hypothetical protein
MFPAVICLGISFKKMAKHLFLGLLRVGYGLMPRLEKGLELPHRFSGIFREHDSSSCLSGCHGFSPGFHDLRASQCFHGKVLCLMALSFVENIGLF